MLAAAAPAISPQAPLSFYPTMAECSALEGADARRCWRAAASRRGLFFSLQVTYPSRWRSPKLPGNEPSYEVSELGLAARPLPRRQDSATQTDVLKKPQDKTTKVTEPIITRSSGTGHLPYQAFLPFFLPLSSPGRPLPSSGQG